MDRNLESDDFNREVLECIKEKKPQSVEELKFMLSDVIALPEEEILKIILNLREKEIIKLDYIKARSSDRGTPTSTWFILTIAIGIITLLTVFAIPENLFPWIYIRNFFGLAFVLFLPGFSFVKAFFPINLPKNEGQKELEIIEQIAYSVGLSIALVSLSGLLLYYSPFGLSLEAIVITIFAITLIFCTSGEIRQKNRQNLGLPSRQ